MNSEFYTILTKIGIAKIIDARASGKAIVLSKFKASSKVIIPKEEMQNLEEIVYEANINSKYVDEKNDHHLILECIIGANEGGFEINAIGIYDDENDLIAIGNVPRTYKPLLEEGAAKEIIFKIIMELSNTKDVILELDKSMALASKDYIDNMKINLLLPITSNSNAILKIFNEKIDKIKGE
ncbi:phage-related tail fiber protein [Campylobacter lari]|uniref:phage tail protein n=1 Tax=Campylobacter lari TaxID=201 RepID=UPI0021536AB6|nr:phage tail protein [Campylobacter lari]MCR6526886.1 phage tail protein [Campylobacter lari]